MKLRVLVLENDPDDAFFVQRELRDVATVDVALNGAMFRKMLEEEWGVILVDLGLPDITGADAIRLAKSKHPATPVIIVTGSVGPAEADAACEYGASRFFIKQVDGLPGLARAVAQAHEASLQAAELELLKAQAIKDQRLEILGHLSTGITHDFNGVLQVCMMGTESLRDKVSAENQRILDAMMAACKRGGQMVAQLLAFARGSNGADPKAVAPEFIFGEIGQIMRSAPGAFPNIRFHFNVEPGTPKILCDATQIHQICMNLATNSRDAMGEKGGDIHFSAQKVTLNNESLQGDFVLLSVRDNGPGIPEEILHKIWSPFFTTKPRGKGTGMGLAIVKAIITAHGGDIDVKTGTAGTIFYLYLPVAPESDTTLVKRIEVLDGAGELIVVADDEEFIRSVVSMFLRDAGYRVLEACNGAEAINHFRSGQKIDLLLSDCMMPAIDGPVLVRAIREQGYGVKTIFFTGYDAQVPRDPEPNATVQKPIERAVLLQTVKDVLASQGAGD